MRASVLCFVSAILITVALAEQEPSLVILPSKENLAPVGSSLAITCKPNVPDPKLIRQLQWRDDKNREINAANHGNTMHVQYLPGEPAVALIFSSLTENQEGEYFCHAFYASTEPLKASTYIKTYVGISFVDAPESQYPIAGKDFYIKCKVQGNPTPQINWYKNDKVITTNNKFVIVNEELLVKNVTEMDDGEYRCTAVVLMTGQIQNRNIKVEVQVPPKIAPLRPVTVTEGESTSTICKATGKPPPKYTWIKENTREDLARTDRFDVRENTGELFLNRVEYKDDSNYICIAENSAGRANETVKIIVNVKPNIYELLNVTAPITNETKIICKAYGRPPPKVVFRKLSSKEPFTFNQQKNDRRIILEQRSFQDKGETYGTLIIQHLNRSDDGLYECIAENEAGTAYKNGHIAVEFPPTFERTRDLPPFWTWEGKPGNLSCLPEAIPNATIIWKHNGIQIEDNQVFKKVLSGAQSFLIVAPSNDRRLFTKYECVASNKLGTASILIPLNYATVPAPISQARPEHITATTIKFVINPPPNNDGLPLRSFTVQYRPEMQLSWDFAYNHTWSFGAPYILEGLVPEVTYHFRFAAKNDVGLGPWINTESVTMPRRSEPSEPKILTSGHTIRDENSSNRPADILAVSPYADHFELRWNVPTDNGDPIQHYLIRYCVTEKINGQWRDTECSEQIEQSKRYTNYQLGGLHPDTIYKIELRAHNAIGDSSPAQIRVKTARGLDPIVPVKQSSMSSSTIIGIVIGAILLVLLVVDITCFCVNRTGIIALLCDHSKAKQADEEDPKLGREEREPLKPAPLNGEKPMVVEFDGQRVYSKSGEIIGKHSAV